MITRPITRPITSPIARRINDPLGIWSPRALFALGEQGWYFDNSDFSTLFQDAAGTTPVTAAGQPVGLQLDLSGRGNHRFQATAASRPMLRQNAITGAYYFELDGSDDWMQTNAINFTSTDKVTLFTGVRKLSDAAVAVISELSGSKNDNTGVFGLYSPIVLANKDVAWYSKGSLEAGAFSVRAAPSSFVAAGVGDIASDVARLRMDGVLVGSSPSDQGTGNYGNHAAYFFRRGGTTLPFNGHEYGSICVGRLCTTAEISAIERLLGKRVGVAIP